MNEAEIMKCAAILAAGIIAQNKSDRLIAPEEAVALMESIADAMEKSREAKAYKGTEWL